MVSNEVYEREIERISPKLEQLKDRPFDEIMKGLYNELNSSSITLALIFALTYVLDPDRFFIEIGHGFGRYVVRFAADTPLGSLGVFVYKLAQFDKMPTEKEVRDFIKGLLVKEFYIEGLLKKAYGVVDTCKIIRSNN